MGAGGRVQAAGASIGYMGFDGSDFQAFHEGFRCLAPTLQVEGYYATATIAQIFFCQRMIFIGGQTRIAYIVHLGLLFQEFSHSLTVFHVARHAHMEGFQS